MMKPVYLDNNATTRVTPEVIDAMLPFFSELYGNPSSMHTFGSQVGTKIQNAREQVAFLLGAASEDEILFTSCGTESDATAIFSALKAFPEKKHLITSTVEHPAVKVLFERLAKEKGYRVTAIPVDHAGKPDMALFEKALNVDTALVSIMWANNETGVIFPVEEMGKLCRKRGILFHTDAVQAVGKIPMDLKNTPIDMLSLSGHKFHAPKGVGALYIRKDIPFHPLLVGGHQEQGRRAGTESVASIIGLGRACELAKEKMEKENSRIKGLRDRLEKTLLEKISAAFVNGNPEKRLPNTSSISFEFIESESILFMLNQHGIYASSGSACTSGALEPSHVLCAMGIPITAIQGTIRFSLGIYNTDEDVDAVITHLPPIVTRLRGMSPFWPRGL